jgi:hypothetical protein
MSYELRTLIAALLPPASAVKLIKVTVAQDDVLLQLTVRKFVCRNPSCERRIFTERLPDLVAPSARKSTRLIMTLRAIGMALGGQAGARLAARLRLPASPATLLRVDALRPLPHPPLAREWGR